MSNPQAFANNQDPLEGSAPTDSFPTDTNAADALQPETQGDEPIEAELGEEGQGDLAPEDEGNGHSGDAPTDLRDGTE